MEPKLILGVEKYTETELRDQGIHGRSKISVTISECIMRSESGDGK